MVAPRIGFIGLGAMGYRMAGQLLARGHELTVHNRTRTREAELVSRGASSAASAQELAATADVVVSCLLHDEAIQQVYLSGTGMVAAARPGQIFIEHATFSPKLAREVSSALNARGAAFIDAPVSGGPEGASAGTLTAMVGGDSNSVANAIELMRSYASTIVHVGPAGSGLELKLINQLLVTCHAAAAAEADELMRRMGIAPQTAATVLNASWGGSAMLARLLQRRQSGADPRSEATIGGLREPQHLVHELLDQYGVRAPVAAAALDTFADARARGKGEHDITELVSAAP